MNNSAKKAFDSPDEVRRFEKGRIERFKLPTQVVARVVFEPGWKWSECVKPVVGTESCQAHHLGYAVSGNLHIVMNDGTEFDAAPGELYEIQPGHDAWVVGDGQFIGLEFEPKTAAEYAK